MGVATGRVGILKALAILYDVPSVTLTGRDGVECREVIAPGAFDESIALMRNPLTGRSIRCVYNHKWNQRVPGPFLLKGVKRGVAFCVEAPLPDNLSGFSFLFDAAAWTRSPGDVFTLTKGWLSEISILTYPRWPAYPATLETVRWHRLRRPN